MKKGLLALASATILSLGSAYAQQDPQFTQFMFNGLFYNPAVAGMDGAARFQLLHRTQWLGNTGLDKGMTPNTQVLSFNTPFLRINSGVGLHLVNDQLGPQTNQEAQVSYAYHLPLGSGRLSLGVRGGMYSKTIDWSLYRPTDKDDAVIRSGSETQVGPDLAGGVFYKTDKWFGGVGVNRLLATKFDFGEANLNNPLARNVYVNGGYNFEINYAWTITPTVLMKSDMNTFQVEGGALATFNNKFFAGATYRQNDAAAAIVGIAFLKDNAMRFSYSIDFSVPNVEVKRLTSHEVVLSYTLPVELRGSKPIIRTPRYRK